MTAGLERIPGPSWRFGDMEAEKGTVLRKMGRSWRKGDRTAESGTFLQIPGPGFLKGDRPGDLGTETAWNAATERRARGGRRPGSGSADPPLHFLPARRRSAAVRDRSSR